MNYVKEPKEEVTRWAEELEGKADGMVENLLITSGLDLRDVDVVVSGGGNYDAFYMGVHMIFSRLSTSEFSVSRYAGTSAGGMMPFEFTLRGLRSTLSSHLSWGVLTSEYPEYFSNAVSAAYQQDHGWRLLADWQAVSYPVSDLDGVVYLGTSCLTPFPELVMISSYDKDTAAAAFMSTGTFLQYWDGMICSDGGATAGPNMTPLFQDGVRGQVIVDLMKTGYPGEMVYKVNTEQYKELIEVGMSEAVRFLETGNTERDGIITFCGKGRDVTGNVCK